MVMSFHRIVRLGNVFRSLGPTKRNILLNISRRNQLSYFSTQANDHLRVVHNKEKQFLELQWLDGSKEKFANIFLRDHCNCPLCFNTHSNNRLLEPFTLSLDVYATDIQIDQTSLTITWSDNHISTFSFDYLKSVQQGLLDDVRYIPPKLWKASDLSERFRTYRLSDLIENEELMLDWFMDLKNLGVTKLTDAGTKIGALNVCKDKLFGGYYKPTHYGYTFDVISKRDANNMAYTSQPLWPHVDLPHFHHMPGIQVLHCLVQTAQAGGMSTLVDGFQAAEQLKHIHPDSFEFLANYKVRYRDIGSDYFGEFETFCERPIIQLEEGKYQGIYHINFQRDYGNHGSVDDIQMFYKSLYRFTQLLIHPNNQFHFKLKPGDVLIFDNTRVLHGRTGFETKPVNEAEFKETANIKNGDEDIERWLHGCYFDWDQIFWKIRPIKRRVEAKNETFSKHDNLMKLKTL